MNDCGVCLDYRHLQHLILSDKAGYEALQSVSLFLGNNMNDNSVFNLNKQKPTLNLAEKYAGQHFMSDWQEEKSDAEVRVDEHWNEVIRKKDLASKLRTELKQLNSEVAAAEDCVDIAREELDSRDTDYHFRSLQKKFRRCTRKVKNLKNQVNEKKKNIKGK